jgi:hypothetical protein
MQGREPLGQTDDPVMQIPTMDVQRCHLRTYGSGNTRVAVADARHVVVHVDIAPTIGIKQPRPLPAHDVQGIRVKQRGPGTQRTFATLKQI